jgi:signal transduction histidine kinase
VFFFKRLNISRFLWFYLLTTSGVFAQADVKAIILKAKKYKYSHHLDSTKYYFKKGLNLALKKKDSVDIFLLYKNMGDAYEHHQKLDSTLLMYDYCKQYTPKNNLKIKAFLLNDLAYTYQLFHDYDKATQLTLEALRYAEKSKNENQISSISITLAYNFSKQKLDKQAEYYFKKALSISEKSNYTPLKEYNHRYYGNYLLERNKLDLAYRHISQSAKLALQTKDSVTMAFAWMGLADCFWKKNEVGKCFFYAKKAEGIWQRRAEYIDYAQVCMNQGTYYCQLKDYKNAEIYFKKSEKHLLNDLYFNEKLFSHLATLYKKMEDIEQAFFYINKAKTTIEKIKENESKSKVAALNIQFDTEKKEQLIAEQNRENELVTYKIKQKNNELRQIYIGMILLVLTIFLIAYFYRLNVKRKNIIQSQKEDLDELNATKDKLFSIVSHDLRSSVNALKSSNNKLMECLENKNYEALDGLLHKNSAIANGSYNLLDNLLNWANQQTNQIYFEKESLHLKTVVNHVEYNFRPLTVEKNIDLIIEVDHSHRIFMDLDSLKIVLRNLLDNALKFTKENGKISIRSQSENNDFVVLTIADNGVGMNQKIIDDLLDDKNLLSKKNDKEAIGSGLGFQLCKTMIYKNSGKIKIESEIGVGTKIILYLPKL